MSEVEQLRVHIEALETHLARLEGVVHDMLEELESGDIRETAAEIRKALPPIEPG